MRKLLAILVVMGVFMSWQKETRAVAMTGTCGWCGATCQRTTVGQMCMDVVPPAGKTCLEENGVCVIKDIDGGREILPVVTDTILPTQGQGGCVESKGETNGDGKVDLVDFSIWKTEYLAATKGSILKADFNCDTNVDLVDFSIWKENYLKV